MHLAPERVVPQQERDKAALDCLTDWDAARVFIGVVRRGSFRSAAERLELSIDGVRRRIDDFEIDAALLRAWQENDTSPAASAIRYLAFPIPAAAASRVRHMIDRLVEAFNPAKFPWFKDEFVHPREFKAVYKVNP
jgi:hypothetical protein